MLWRKVCGHFFGRMLLWLSWHQLTDSRKCCGRCCSMSGEPLDGLAAAARVVTADHLAHEDVELVCARPCGCAHTLAIDDCAPEPAGPIMSSPSGQLLMSRTMLCRRCSAVPCASLVGNGTVQPFAGGQGGIRAQQAHDTSSLSSYWTVPTLRQSPGSPTVL